MPTYRYRCPFCGHPAPRVATLEAYLESQGKSVAFRCRGCGHWLRPLVPFGRLRVFVVGILPALAFWAALLFVPNRLYVYILLATPLWIGAAVLLMPYTTYLQAADPPASPPAKTS